MSVHYAHNGDVSIAYETFGDPTGEPLLLIMGLDFQMVWWPEGFCEALADAGFHVARFDNRDTGLSTHFASPRRRSPWRALAGRTKPAYTGTDMIDDALAVMDALGWKSAHVAGASLGSAIAQGMALLHPARVRALVVIMGGPANAGVFTTIGNVKFGVFREFRKIRTETRADTLFEIFRILASPGYPLPEEWARRTAALSDSRSPRDPGSTQRQIAAGRAIKLPPLSRITAPTLVLSGADDPLIRPRAGRSVARQIPDALFVAYPGMGHNIPEELWPDMIDRITALTTTRPTPKTS
jgi:pimeloyl-ACP methyl ester carboxylesterase